MHESPLLAFDELVAANPPAEGRILFETACVLGGSVAGLLSARVLSDYAREVVIVERDDVSSDGRSRYGTPHDQQVHTLLPAGRRWIERWLPGFIWDARELGAVVSEVDATYTAFDGHRQAISGDASHGFLLASRPFLEARIREHVLDLPNVRMLHARASGLEFRDGAVSAVRHVDGSESAGTLEADFVVDAMGRSSRLADWLSQHGFERPSIERLKAPINYATALFERSTPSADLKVASALAIFSAPDPAAGNVSIAAANAIEGNQWLVMLMGYGDDRPGQTIEEFRRICAKLPDVFGEATRGAVTRDVVTYHQDESRRRNFAALTSFPARLVSAGDAVASFNPIYGQGMSSAALHASCLASYLAGPADLTVAATEFFHLQQVVVDAAWAISAGGDRARLDAVVGVEVSEDVRRQRAALQQVIGATLVDPDVARAFNDVSYMLRHPATLAEPAVLERAVSATQAASRP
jgi:2-polyprenyl-6-methoxyphenol hydroxylase-like FAD-dependent oxidoreductase